MRTKKTGIGKKGSLLDPLYIILIVFAFAIVAIICYLVINEFQEHTQDKLTSPTAQYALAQGEATILNFDNLIVFVLIGLLIGTLVGAYMIQSTPIIFWISSTLLFVFVTLAVTFSNVFERIIGEPSLSPYAADFSLTQLIMSNLPLTIIVIFLLVGIVLFAKWRSI